MLGITFDTKLVMDNAVHEIALEANWRLKSLLRCRRFFDVASMFRLYKSQVLSFIEARTAGIYHLPSFFLTPIDNIQRRFLEAVDIDPIRALLDFNLAPLCTRRDVSMLGFLHRFALGLAPAEFGQFIKRKSVSTYNRGWAVKCELHDNQIHDPIDGTHTRMMERSIFALVYPYNSLPLGVAKLTCVSAFQRALQRGVKKAATSQEHGWQSILRTGPRGSTVRAFQELFH